MTEVDRIMENRALLAALELSMLNLNNTTYSTASPDPPNGLFDDAPESPLGSKKSQNITQCVSVPTSEHVAEIVGRQGCKIKALRAKTNTYIKTPVRGEDPIFIITGRPEDVSVAKKEILQAADHFSQIRASRRSNSVSPPNVDSTLPGMAEKVTIFVRVPYRVVGLVVGPKGATVKRIQQNTGTFIITPSREMEPYFEVRGTPENVELARKEIESHIAVRTGGGSGSFDQIISPTGVNGGSGGLVHCMESPSTSPTEIGGGMVTMATSRNTMRRTMSVSDPSSMLHHHSRSGVLSNAPSVSETYSGGHRTSPLSNAVFASGSHSNLENDPAPYYNHHHHSIPMSAPATSLDKVFDFGGSRAKQYSSNWNGSWSPQPSTPVQSNNGSWGFHLLNNKPTSPQPPPSPTGSWGSSPQPPSPTGSWGSNSSEGNAVMSPRAFPSGFVSSSTSGNYSRIGSYLQQQQQTRKNGYRVVPCCYCEQSEADTILVPCGHKTMCFECACKISAIASVCPSCNTKIESLAQQLRS